MDKQDCQCGRVNHEEFNKVVAGELAAPVTLAEMADTGYCVPFAPWALRELEEIQLPLGQVLADLGRKVGVYIVWLSHSECGDHLGKVCMEAVYVGKGSGKGRLMSHFREERFANNELYSLTFYECSNRIAKYLEQALLDSYNFQYNSDENHGVVTLYTVWDECRYLLGTQLHETAERSAKRFPEVFAPPSE